MNERDSTADSSVPMDEQCTSLASEWEAGRLIETLRDHAPELRERYKVRSLWLFGSYVWGRQRPDSDLDILMDYSQTPTLADLVELEQHLTELLGIKVDLVTVGGLRGRIGERILAEAIPV